MSIMPLNQALHILTELNTKDDPELGFIIESTSIQFDPTEYCLEDLINAWKSVRYNIGKQVVSEQGAYPGKS